jgi:hypothetical protein
MAKVNELEIICSLFLLDAKHNAGNIKVDKKA